MFDLGSRLGRQRSLRLSEVAEHQIANAYLTVHVPLLRGKRKGTACTTKAAEVVLYVILKDLGKNGSWKW